MKREENFICLSKSQRPLNGDARLLLWGVLSPIHYHNECVHGPFYVTRVSRVRRNRAITLSTYVKFQICKFGNQRD